MTTNSRGTYATTPALTMAAFDRLPATARRALASAARDWAPQQFLRAWLTGAKGHRTGPEIARRVADADRLAYQNDKAKGVTP